jgi:hypothetical protein
MGEEQWLVCCNPERMLGAFERGASDRKLRLLACGWLRLLWDLLTPRGRKVVEVLEGCADGEAREADVARARCRVTEVGRRTPPRAAAAWALFYAAGDARADLADCLRNVRLAADRGGRLGETDLALCHVLRDVVGNPFRPPELPPTRLWWKGDAVALLARSAYDSRPSPAGPLASGPFADLVAALGRAGCTDPVLLDHCRRRGEHVRGCWALDLILGLS